MSDVHPDRKRIWEVSCFHKDVILVSSFEREELVRIAEHHTLCTPGHAEFPGDMGIFHHVHTHCHDQSPLAEEVQATLEGSHRRFLARYLLWVYEEVQQKCFSEPLSMQTDLPGLIWAIGTDARPRFECMGHPFLHKTVAESIREKVFGSRELFLLQHKNSDLQHELDDLKQKLKSTT